MRSGSEDFERLENPRKNSNIFSRITFWYSLKIFMKGRNRDLEDSDLTKPLDEHKSAILGEKLAQNWMKELSNATKLKRPPSLASAIMKTFRYDIIYYAIVLFIMEFIIRMSQPVFIGLFIRYFTEENIKKTGSQYPPTWFMRVLYYYFDKNQSRISIDEAYFFGFGILICSLLIVSTFHPYIMEAQHVGMKVRVACCSLIYRKVLRLKFSILGGKVVGNTVNLMSNDVMRFDMAPMFLHYLWIAPLQGVLITYLVYVEIGVASFYGMIAVVAVMPLQIALGFVTSCLRSKAAQKTDDRVRQMNEIIQAMQVIKMYAWENAFAAMINTLRKNELKILLLTSYIRGISMSFIMFTARTGIFLTVLAYVLIDNDISAEIVFLIGTYYLIIRQTLTVYFPQGLNAIAETAVSIQRIQEFLLSDEATIGDRTVLDANQNISPNQLDHALLLKKLESLSSNGTDKPNSSTHTDNQPVISLVRAISKYGDNLCLDNININIKPGELVAVVGPVGSGKTCLLNLILGELRLFSGKMIVNGVISFASQEPWMFVGSVRQNILFGKEFDAQRYQTIIKVCALVRDFSVLPYADRTLVGERGTSLSGGQRARINLARAVYKQADIYLLDDPLSAVDIQVGQQLFEECMLKYLADKVVILVTHQLQYLKRADKIIILNDGAIQIQGTYEEIKTSGVSFALLLEEAANIRGGVPETNDVDKVLRAISITSTAFNSMIDIEGLKEGPRRIAEMRTIGSVDFINYKEYFLAGANCCAIIIMWLLFIGAQFLASGGDYFLSQWVTIEELRYHYGSAEKLGFWNKLSRLNCIEIYTAFIVATIIVAIIRSIYFFSICMSSSLRLHNRMFESVIHAAMSFFYANSSGRILNRFSKDLGQVDELLPTAFIDTTQLLLNLLGAMIVVCLINPWLIIPVIVMIALFFILRNFYLKTSRSVKRLEGITRSPVFAHLNATLQGLATIRVNNAEQMLVEEFDHLQDIHSGAWFMFLFTSRAFSLWLDCITASFIGVVTFSFVFMSESYYGSDVGLTITQCIGLTGLIQWGLRQSAELENQMTSVERVLEFTRIEHEPDLDSPPDKVPPRAWPKTGHIEFINTTMRYTRGELPVLKQLNLEILPQEKIGIVGRTGAGKSSLIVTLFRLGYLEGDVLIDNIDISVLGLHDLRRKISIIPQEPVLFNGTLRYNLDPFGEYEDEDILKALIDVEDKWAMAKGLESLDKIVTERGTNISIGQRQMICLARAILRNNKILVMDEATANVDAQTDKLIQKTIRTKFAHCTVLTVAHRLQTVMDSDKMLVLDAGQVVEFDHPHILLQNPNGYLSELVKKTGPGTADYLRRIAQENFDRMRKEKRFQKTQDENEMQ